MVQAKIRNLKTGAISDHRFRSVDMVERAILDETEMEYLYQDGDMYHFMNNETFEQIGLSDEMLGDAVDYLIPNIKLKIEFYEGRPVGIDLPLTVEMKVMETEPGDQGRDRSRTWASPPRWRPAWWSRCRPSSTRATSSGSTPPPASYVERVSK